MLASALALFAEHGYAATSVRMIAGAAGVSQGLLPDDYPLDAVSAALVDRFAVPCVTREEVDP